jgi:trehalose/maltose hydrolase-like predicted phosphorylase
LFKGDKFVFHVITALISTAQHSDPKNEAIRVLTKAASTNQTSLIQSHYNLWQTSWANDIVITGNDDDQKNIRIMLYHLYSFIN